MENNLDEELLESESSPPNLSEEELSQLKETSQSEETLNLEEAANVPEEEQLEVTEVGPNGASPVDQEEEHMAPVGHQENGELNASEPENASESAEQVESLNEKSPVKIVEEKKKKKPTTEGSNFQTKINVGFNHQVPFTPAFFLDYSYNNSSSTSNSTSTNSSNQKHEWARLMYSPYQMEKIRRRKLKENVNSSVIKNEFELAEFIQMCAKNWKNSPGWHPFSPEFAYKILHFADYDPNKALKFMNDPSFNFSCVCDPPVRRYDNKWKPKDRRGQLPTNPYPPPVTLRGYLLRRHTMK